MLQPDGRRSTEDCWQLSISEHSKINGKEIATVCPLRPNEIKGSLQSLLNLGSSLLFQNQIFSFHMHAIFQQKVRRKTLHPVIPGVLQWFHDLWTVQQPDPLVGNQNNYLKV